MADNIPTVILAGGLGMRMRDYSDILPKALVPIGNKAVIHHVMDIYASQGFNKFIVCLGYGGDQIKNYFCNLDIKLPHLRVNTRSGTKESLEKEVDDFEIDFIYTGLNSLTGERIRRIKDYVKSEDFFVTYCDGLANINLTKLLNHHRKMGKSATLTATHTTSPFGIVETNGGMVESFKEKPVLLGYINGGFFVFNRRAFDYIFEGSTLEEEPLRNMAKDRQLAAYNHEGFWACMDTPKDIERLNSIWERGLMPHAGIHYDQIPWKKI